jgi:hypothetical protein
LWGFLEGIVWLNGFVGISWAFFVPCVWSRFSCLCWLLFLSFTKGTPEFDGVSECLIIWWVWCSYCIYFTHFFVDWLADVAGSFMLSVDLFCEIV